MRARICGPDCQRIPASLAKKGGHKPKEPVKPALCVL